MLVLLVIIISIKIKVSFFLQVVLQFCYNFIDIWSVLDPKPCFAMDCNLTTTHLVRHSRESKIAVSNKPNMTCSCNLD